MNIALIGYRGTGKSVVGRELAKRTGREVVSTDEKIVEKAGTGIPRIVEKHGWDHFRDIESEVVEELNTRDGIIVDAGGGVIVRDRNTAALRRNAMVFWLTATVDTIVNRIATDDQRPSLTGKKSFIEEIEEVLEQRTPLYRAAAHHTVDTDGKTVEDLAEEILDLFETTSDQ